MVTEETKAIVQRYFRGQLSDNEYERLTSYLKDRGIREYFDQVRMEWEKNPEWTTDGLRNWKQLQYKIRNYKIDRKASAPFTKWWVKAASLAAVLVIGLLLGSIATKMVSDESVKPEEIVFETPRGEKSLVRLPDGTVVWLNAKSRLVYQSFTSKNRTVELTGEAFFKVARDEHAPFFVKTNECTVEVLGTTFNVMAYDEFGRKEITLLEGMVNVQVRDVKKGLDPGQALIFRDNKIRIVAADTMRAVGWVSNKFNFYNIPLSELIKRLENWYDVDIQLENPSRREVNYTGTFKNEETIWQVLDAIRVYTPISYTRSDLRKIKITVVKK